MDKIFTNMYDWYSTPAKLPAVGSSDHAAVLMQASTNPNYSPGILILSSLAVSVITTVKYCLLMNWLILIGFGF